MFGYLTLLSPPTSMEEVSTRCAGTRIVSVAADHQFVYNCDSRVFMQAGEAPSELLEEHHVRQSRPLYVVTASIMSVPFRVVAPIGDTVVGKPVFLAYLTMNAALLVAAGVIFDRLVGPPLLATSALGALLVANYLVKAFLWTPHTQMFNVLTPLVGVALVFAAVRHRWSIPSTALIGLGIGIASLAYGAFIGVAVAVALGILAGHWGDGSWRRAAPRVSALLIGFAIPQVLWMTLARLVAGSYYSHELASGITPRRPFLWVWDSLDEGPAQLASTAWANLVDFTTVSAPVVWAPLTLVVVLVAVAYLTGVRVDSLTQRDRVLLLAVALMFVCYVPFLYLGGFYRWRLSWSLVPLLLLLAAQLTRLASNELTRRRAALLTCGVLAFCAAWIGVTLATPGPYG